MQLGKKVINYIKDLSYTNFNTLYICNKSKVYLKYENNTCIFDTAPKDLSINFKRILKKIDDFFIVNNPYYDVLKEDNINIIKGLIVINIDNNRFFVFTSHNNFYTKEDVDKLLNFSKGIKKYIIR